MNEFGVYRKEPVLVVGGGLVTDSSEREQPLGGPNGASEEVKKTTDIMCRDGIYEMLKLETPNLHEIMLEPRDYLRPHASLISQSSLITPKASLPAQ